MFNRRFGTNKLPEATVKTSGFSITSTGKTVKLKIKFFPEGELTEILMLEHPREGIFYSLEIE